MGDMPKLIWAGRDVNYRERWQGIEPPDPDSALTKAIYTMYLRADIHEAELTKLRNALDVAERALGELYAQVKGECPRLLNDDSGGDAQLDMDIQDALTTIKQAKGEV